MGAPDTIWMAHPSKPDEKIEVEYRANGPMHQLMVKGWAQVSPPDMAVLETVEPDLGPPSPAPTQIAPGDLEGQNQAKQQVADELDELTGKKPEELTEVEKKRIEAAASGSDHIAEAAIPNREQEQPAVEAMTAEAEPAPDEPKEAGAKTGLDIKPAELSTLPKIPLPPGKLVEQDEEEDPDDKPLLPAKPTPQPAPRPSQYGSRSPVALKPTPAKPK